MCEPYRDPDGVWVVTLEDGTDDDSYFEVVGVARSREQGKRMAALFDRNIREIWFDFEEESAVPCPSNFVDGSALYSVKLYKFGEV